MSACGSMPPAARTCFVMQPFTDGDNRVYTDVFVPAIRSAGLEPRRGDSIFTVRPIMEDIFSMISEADILIAVLTEQNPNVYYELGIAHALGKPVVMVTASIESIPFDLKSLRHVTYDMRNPDWGRALVAKLEQVLPEVLAAPDEAVFGAAA